jgi:hypothetical protein
MPGTHSPRRSTRLTLEALLRIEEAFMTAGGGLTEHEYWWLAESMLLRRFAGADRADGADQPT